MTQTANSLHIIKAQSTIVKNSLYVICGSVFLVLFSQISIPLPFTPVPQTMQTLAVFLLGASLGSRLGTLSVLTYLAEGTMGLPVFAGGASNPLWFCSTSAGFLMGFVFAAYCIGKIIEKRPYMGIWSLIATITLGQAIISCAGTLWLSFFVGLIPAFMMGTLPFLGGAFCKVVSAALLIRGIVLGKQTILDGSHVLR